MVETGKKRILKLRLIADNPKGLGLPNRKEKPLERPVTFYNVFLYLTVILLLVLPPICFCTVAETEFHFKKDYKEPFTFESDTTYIRFQYPKKMFLTSFVSILGSQYSYSDPQPIDPLLFQPVLQFLDINFITVKIENLVLLLDMFIKMMLIVIPIAMVLGRVAILTVRFFRKYSYFVFPQDKDGQVLDDQEDKQTWV